MNRRILSIFLTGLALAITSTFATSVSAQAKKWETVTIATEGAYKPWNLTKPNGELDGFEIDLVKVLCNYAKIKCKLVANEWQGMIEGLNAGKFDVIMDSILITEERKKTVLFSEPYAKSWEQLATTNEEAAKGLKDYAKESVYLTGGNNFVIPADKMPIIDDMRAKLKGKTFGIVSGTAFTPFVDKYFKDIMPVREYKTSAEHDFDLKAKRIEVIIDDYTYIQPLLSKPGFEKLVVIGPKFYAEGTAFGFRKSTPELKALFDKAIERANKDGTISKLSQKWFGFDLAPKG